jgi:hypothetical protein
MFRYLLPLTLLACAPEYQGLTSMTEGEGVVSSVTDSLAPASAEGLEQCGPSLAGLPWEVVEPNVHLLVDVSGSMQGRRWDELVSFTETLTDRAMPARLGLSLFPADGYCGADEPQVVAGEVDGPAAIADAVHFSRPGGATPMAAALDALVGRPELQAADREQRVVLLTDGVESCDGDPAEAIDALVHQDEPVSLRVVGLGTFPHTDVELQALADLAAPTTADTTLLTAASARELEALLDELSASCRFAVDAPVSQVSVDGRLVEDFAYDEGLGQVILGEEACEAYYESPCGSLTLLP